MSNVLPKEQSDIAKEFLRHRYYMPHIVAVWCLERIGVTISTSAVMQMRRRNEFPYGKDNRVHNAVQAAMSRDLPITHEYLLSRCPHICQEYREYLVASYVRKNNISLPPMHVRSPELMRLQLTGGNYAR
jgi:hypothetical protein